MPPTQGPRRAGAMCWDEDGRPHRRSLPRSTPALYSRGRLLTLAGAGHLLPFERPAEVAAAIRRFWEEEAGVAPVVPVDADFAGGYLIQSLGAMPLTYATSLARGAGLWGRELIVPKARITFSAGANVEAVVDSDGRSFDVPNLWVCDNSVFPSSLIANPALATMALSLRTADRFLAA
ncbi:GMC family oxidoreductase [Rathayibacter rathayi]|uniref:GMC family oxidoreductase n=1 Tax=Rathayibacter rathayi TaxID=33887 RepID=UPI0021578ECB|nr:GMC family oxidoreductase [Rathayibacter rathayi]